MVATYQVAVQNTVGGSIDIFDQFISLSYARSFNTKGALSITIPDVVYPGYIDRDYRLLIYRSVDSRPPQLDMDAFWLIRSIQYNSDDKTWTIQADDPLSILHRRLIAYKSKTLYADKNFEEHSSTFAADDMIKAYIRENLGALSIVPETGVVPDPDRDLSEYLTIDADTSDGPQMEKASSFQNLLTCCQQIARTSAQLGTLLYFDIIVQPNGQLVFKTWTQLRGTNRGEGSAAPLIFYPDHNLEGLVMTWDYTDEFTYVYAGGEDSGDERLIVKDGDFSRIALSPWGRIEHFLDLRDMGNEDMMNDEIDAALYGGRGRLQVTGSPIEIEGTQYGIDYFYGDVVQVSVLGYSVDSVVDSVSVSVDDSGEEVSVQLSGEIVL